ncbi:MAG: helix-turn-helix domain-containing protein [Pseudomonas sp.]|nr:helix-turn-helix domain-containing protein [Pseudomonas sp.]
MSMLLMVKAMQVQVGNPLRKLVLIKLADNANDLGECWPSYQHIADQCEISRRSVINHIKALEEIGFLVKKYRKGTEKRNASNVYTLNFNVSISFDGAAPALGGGAAPALGGAAPALEGGAAPAPRTSHSFEPVNEPNGNLAVTGDKKPRFDPLSIKPENISAEQWTEWVKYRRERKISCSKMTIEKQISLLESEINPIEVINQSITNGWQGLFSIDRKQGSANKGFMNRHTGFSDRDYGKEGLNEF